MVLMTMVARVADGLPLAASIQEEEQVNGTSVNNPTPIQSLLGLLSDGLYLVIHYKREFPGTPL